MATNPTPIYLTDRELAARYGVAAGSIWRWARDQKNSFPSPVKLSDNCTRWKLSDIEAWEASREVA